MSDHPYDDSERHAHQLVLAYLASADTSAIDGVIRTHARPELARGHFMAQAGAMEVGDDGWAVLPLGTLEALLHDYAELLHRVTSTTGRPDVMGRLLDRITDRDPHYFPEHV